MVDATCEICEGCKELILDDETLVKCMKILREQIELGLNPETKNKSSVKCFNTYVQNLPTGKEKGQFLALDLGGTNFRVLLITLDIKYFDMKYKTYLIPQSIMLGPGVELFDHIAECLEAFAKEHEILHKNLPLGFTFSFPVSQHGLTKGILQRWTKGFNCDGVIGQDVVHLLHNSIIKKTIKIEIVAVLNDTTGTLMSCAWKNQNCKIGVILGTGSNACYLEKVSNVIGFESETNKDSVIINTEWGAFGDNGELDFIRTKHDIEVDENSINPGKQKHEKMISGMYLGELVRLLLVKFSKDGLLFKGKSNYNLEKGSFLTKYVSAIEKDEKGSYSNCRKTLAKLGLTEISDADCCNVRYICECVSKRAAYLASAGVATLIDKMGVSSVTIGVDGSLYRLHPHFEKLMKTKIPQLVNPLCTNIELMVSEDGSGRGAALVAASCSK